MSTPITRGQSRLTRCILHSAKTLTVGQSFGQGHSIGCETCERAPGLAKRTANAYVDADLCHLSARKPHRVFHGNSASAPDGSRHVVTSLDFRCDVDVDLIELIFIEKRAQHLTTAFDQQVRHAPAAKLLE